jgi:ABC-type amino acid transport system permease subunit
LNAGAYLAEIFRAGIESIDRGQWEAAAALGMTRSQSLRRVILPQSFRRLIPPVVNELAALAKDTSLVSVIALSELLFVTQRLAAKYLRPWEVFFWSAMGYLIVVLALSTMAHRLEKRLALRGA